MCTLYMTHTACGDLQWGRGVPSQKCDIPWNTKMAANLEVLCHKGHRTITNNALKNNFLRRALASAPNGCAQMRGLLCVCCWGRRDASKCTLCNSGVFDFICCDGCSRIRFEKQANNAGKGGKIYFSSLLHWRQPQRQVCHSRKQKKNWMQMPCHWLPHGLDWHHKGSRKMGSYPRRGGDGVGQPLSLRCGGGVVHTWDWLLKEMQRKKERKGSRLPFLFFFFFLLSEQYYYGA